jgi:hypothetical protein
MFDMSQRRKTLLAYSARCGKLPRTIAKLAEPVD